MNIKAEGRNDIRIAAQSAVQGATDCIKDTVKQTDSEGNPIIPEELQQEICGIIAVSYTHLDVYKRQMQDS